MITYLDGHYIGHTAPFTHGHTYRNLQVKQDRLGFGVTAQATHGPNRKPVIGTSLHYPSLLDFFKDWVTGAVYEEREVPKQRKRRIEDE